MTVGCASVPLGVWHPSSLRTFQAVFQAVLHHDKELLERRVVGVQRAAQVECRLDETLDAQLGHVHQVEPLDGNGVLGIWKRTEGNDTGGSFLRGTMLQWPSIHT